MILRRAKAWWRRWPNPIGQASVAGLLCLAAVAGEGTPVREKIVFSGTGDTAARPESRPKDEALTKQLEFLGRGDSVSGVVAPALSPSVFPSYQRNSRL